jgi:hypothetical protein
VISRAVVDGYFVMLEHSLKTIPLPKSDGSWRYAQADEFMLMGISGGVVMFKHRDTRNYIWMDKRTGAISIPIGGAFHRGVFDAFNPVAAAAFFRQVMSERRREGV